MLWTRQRLEEAARTELGKVKLIIVANREPYVHVYDGNEIRWKKPAGGLTVALCPVMQACHGTWVAHGSGSADAAVVDEHDRVAVPPDNPSYSLRRVWLTKEEEDGYYLGFSNDTLWPLCHLAHTRPVFDPDYWNHYRTVNQKFADAVLDELTDEPCLVFVQDYHFALLPGLLRQAHPDLVIIQFWHIPWPNFEMFRICPWARPILEGMLGNDLLGFHIRGHCSNFLDCAVRILGADVDSQHAAVLYQGRRTLVQPHPISVDPNHLRFPEATLSETARQLRSELGIGDRQLLVGVDRIDYTKGIPERLQGVDWLLRKKPELKEKFQFLQVGAPSRTSIESYRRLNEEIRQLAQQINDRHATENWKPIVLVAQQFSAEQIAAIYRTADACVVTSLHDGMNLVAKEFVAARADEQGVLVLSRFTGAADELTDALLVNPYDVEELANALYHALTMPASEQQTRMRSLRQQVQEHNVFRWAGELLAEGARLVQRRQWHKDGVQQLRTEQTSAVETRT
ncbi:MAG: hypothetical protein KatS3mg105_4548 [Gemmatales bacterium]|nr:MAG: hypothetical protein KatS3mg105_4548 [Gemmatales bacterium]